MQFKEPSVHLIAETRVRHHAIQEAVTELGAPGWQTQAGDAETLIEFLGRLCYRAFGTNLNPNLSRVREGNDEYLSNVIRQRHGSIFEHASVTFLFLNVTRVFTHEIVRHRAGTAFSQESLRFVRLDELAAYYPEAFSEEAIAGLLSASREGDVHKSEARDLALWMRNKFKGIYTALETAQQTIAACLHLDDVPSFGQKKATTSAMRRLAPMGLCTSIGVTANHRAWRHMIGMRCTAHAEEEIRRVFFEVAETMAREYPNLYQDATFDHIQKTVSFECDKI